MKTIENFTIYQSVYPDVGIKQTFSLDSIFYWTGNYPTAVVVTWWFYLASSWAISRIALRKSPG